MSDFKHKLWLYFSLGLIIFGVGIVSTSIINMLGATSLSKISVSATVNDDSPMVKNPEIDVKDTFVPIKKGDKVGTISIPKLKIQLFIYEGTTENELLKGVGHYIQSVLPGENDNCVLSAHRLTYFKNLEKLKIGDKIFIQTKEEQLIYIVAKKRIVDKDDRTVIVPTSKAVLTLTTCYPFVYIGNAPKRYIVISNLVNIK